MHIRVASDDQQVGAIAADIVLTHLPRDGILGVATGATPTSTYRAMGDRYALPHVRAFALDEYVGLPVGHPQSYLEVLRRDVAPALGLGHTNIVVPGHNPNVALEDQGAAFEAALARAGGVDVQILGIGENGHIAFNEPGATLDSVTRVVNLDERTRQVNSRYFDPVEGTPRRAITQGLATIMRARVIVLVALGRAKAPALFRAIGHPPTIDVPASILQYHDAVTVVADVLAASQLLASTRRADISGAPFFTTRGCSIIVS